MRSIPTPPILIAFLFPLHADETNFDAAPDASWTRFAPTHLGVFDFNDDVARLSCGTYPLEQYAALVEQYGEAEAQAMAAPRVVLFAPTVLENSCTSVDLLEWKPTTNRSIDGQFTAVFSRIQPGIGMFAVSGYGASIIDLGNGSAELQVTLLFNEAPIKLGGTLFPLDPDTTYRLLLCSRGEVHTARVFDLAVPAAPVAEVSTIDSTFPSGRTGFGVLTDRYFAPEAVFDNFLVWDGNPPPLLVQPGDEPGTIMLVSDFRRSMATDIESTTDLSDPFAPWQPATPASTSIAGNQLLARFPIDSPKRFFRRKSL